MKTLDKAILEFAKEITGKIVEDESEYDGMKWEGNITTDIIKKVQQFINQRYGLGNIAIKNSIPDVVYDKAKNVFIINFEKPAKDPATGKPIISTSIPASVILK